MAVGDELARTRSRIGKAQMVTNIVQPGLQNLEHLFAGDAAALQSAFIHAPKLALQKAVVIPELLFLDQTQSIIGVLAARLGAVNARTVTAALEILRGPKNGQAKSAADANAGT